MTMDTWPWIMYDTYNARGGFSFVLFPIAIIMSNLIADVQGHGDVPCAN